MPNQNPIITKLLKKLPEGEDREVVQEYARMLQETPQAKVSPEMRKTLLRVIKAHKKKKKSAPLPPPPTKLLPGTPQEKNGRGL
jgi:uncharacterized protein YhaN